MMSWAPGITEISMLAARAKSATAPDEKRGGYLDHVGGKARELVTALDEIVWAMNPAMIRSRHS